MYDQRVLPADLLPDWDTLNEWQKHLFNAIEEIQGDWKPYKRPGGSGCTKTRYFRKNIIMRAAVPPVSFCCGAQFEAFFLTWKAWMGEVFQSPDDLTLTQMYKLYAYSFIFDNIPNNEMGLAAPDALPSLLLWLSWLKEENFSVQVITNPHEARFGDFCQIQNSPGVLSGHSCIILGQGEWQEKPVLHAWSSNVNYDQKWPYSQSQQDGHGVDYFYINRQIKQPDQTLWTRKFHIVRISV